MLVLTLTLTLTFAWPPACPGCAGGAEADHSRVPMGWESGLAPRSQRSQPDLGRQAARPRPARGAQAPHAPGRPVSGHCAAPGWPECRRRAMLPLRVRRLSPGTTARRPDHPRGARRRLGQGGYGRVCGMDGPTAGHRNGLGGSSELAAPFTALCGTRERESP